MKFATLSMNDQKKLKNWLLIAFAVETFCATYGLKFIEIIPFLSVLYFVAGISLSVLFLYIPQSTTRQNFSGSLNATRKLKTVAVIVAACLLMYWICFSMFAKTPIDINSADMLPIIKTMDHRLISHHFSQVYEPIPEIWHGTKPIYLPATWIPFALPIAMGVDIRWITWICFSLILALFIIRFRRRNFVGSSRTIIPVAVIALFWWLLTENDIHGFVTLSEEGVIALYYTLLTYAIFSRNTYLIAIAISLCVLSRYALIGWVPSLLLLLLYKREFKQLMSLALVGVICFCALVLPFGLDHFLKLLSLPADYIEFAGRVWRDSPDVFSEGLGFAKFFGAANVAAQHHVLIFATFLTPLMFVLLAIRNKRKFEQVNILLGALKAGIVVFYCFIDVPYPYLFYTSSFISMAAMVYYGSSRTDDYNRSSNTISV